MYLFGTQTKKLTVFSQPKSWGWTFHAGHKEELTKARATGNVREYELMGLYAREWAALGVLALGVVRDLGASRFVDVFGEQDLLIHARAQGWCVPTLDVGDTTVVEGYLPGGSGPAAPMSFRLGARVMLTGANESGKTTTLRALATCVMAAYAGLPVRAKSCSVPLGLTGVALWPAHRTETVMPLSIETTLLLVDEFPKKSESVAQLVSPQRLVVVTHDPALLLPLHETGLPIQVRACVRADSKTFEMEDDVWMHTKRARICRAEELLDAAFS